MAKSAAIVAAMFVCVMLITPHAQAITCDAVLQNLSPCRSSLQGGAVTAKCCDGIKSLKRTASTTAARRDACKCIKNLAKSYKVKSQTASSLANKCKVNIGYPISYNVDCTKVN